MLPPNMNDSLMNSYLSNLFKPMDQDEIVLLREEKKRLGREPPALSTNATLLIELGIVIIVILVIVLIFYLSHRNSKKRSNRRRWMQSDISIDNANNSQIDDTVTEGRHSEPIVHRRRCLTMDIGNERDQSYDGSTVDQTIELARDECPPSYESVVREKSRKRSRNSNRHAKQLDRNSPKRHHTGNEEALLSTQPLTYISTICNENSSLIENQQLASTSSSDNATCNDEGKVCVMRENRLNNDFKEDGLQKVVSATTTTTIGESEINGKQPTKTVRCENGFAVLDASGLPTYDTALKIQECGNI